MKPFKRKRLAKFSLSVGSIVLLLLLLRAIAPGPTYFFATIALVAIVAFLLISAGIRRPSVKRHFHNLNRRWL